MDHSIGYELSKDDSVSCMAAYCTNPVYKPDVSTYASETRYELPSKETADIIKGLDTYHDKEDVVVKDPRVPAKPTTERDARDAYWKALRQHANGSGTIEEVESAYRELLPYRK